MRQMEPVKFKELVNEHGVAEHYTADQVFHAQDFPDKLFMLKSGYVKRYQARRPEQRVLELIYGPGHIISLSQIYKKLFGVDQNQENFIYIYQAMTDVEVLSINADIVMQALNDDPELYKDFFYESGIKLRSNILRLASNSIKGAEPRVAHQLVSLAHEFSGIGSGDVREQVILPLPQTSQDLAEQLNISVESANTALDSLVQKKIITVAGPTITILDLPLLKDVYL